MNPSIETLAAIPYSLHCAPLELLSRPNTVLVSEDDFIVYNNFDSDQEYILIS